MVKPEILAFIEWMFIPENKVFVRNTNPSVVARYYKDQTGKSVAPGTVIYNLYKWIKINGTFYDKEKIPMDILRMDTFKKFAIENDISVEDINGSIWEEKHDVEPATESPVDNDQKESVVDKDQYESLVEDNQMITKLDIIN